MAIEGTLADADLRAALAPFGYDEARLLAARLPAIGPPRGVAGLRLLFVVHFCLLPFTF